MYRFDIGNNRAFHWLRHYAIYSKDADKGVLEKKL